MTDFLLKGRHAVVTGAGNGIGAAIALAYARAGADVVLADIDTARADETARQCREAGSRVEIGYKRPRYRAFRPACIASNRLQREFTIAA